MTTNVDTEKLAQRMHAFTELCGQAGIRVTNQRTEVFREVARTTEHPDAETVYRRVRKRIPAISLDTVYRTLRLMEEKELISKVNYPGDRARFDANTDRHHHFICTQCGLVQDFYSGELDALQPPALVTKFGKVNSVHIQMRGICKDCRENPAS